MKRITRKPGKGVAGKTPKSGQGGITSRRLAKDAPFGVDVSSDGDIASPCHDLNEDEIKEQEDRRS